MKIGVVGKTNVGKSTFFSAATHVDAEISNRIFTTIKPNKGAAYVRTQCPCAELNVKCNPQNSKCIDGTRLVPIELIDIAGLVPGAHEGKGLGNQFLSDIMEASALIHVVDVSGSTDENGNPVAPGTRNPEDDIEFLEKEIDYWILSIIKKLRLSYRVDAKDIVPVIYKQLSGLNIKEEDVKQAANKTGITQKSSDDEMLKFISILRKKSKPMVIAANKIDVEPLAPHNYEKIKSPNVIACSAEAELALRRAADNDIIEYVPGAGDFKIIGNIDEKKRHALNFIRKILDKYGSTGVQQCIDKAVFSLLNMIIVYPVADAHRYTDKKGNILPDAYLLPKGSTAIDLAYAVHEDIGKKFIAATDCRTGKNIGASHPLQNGDIVSIKSGR
jgi:ribosome-binding ATPase YchF (GTP1/OBG family)